MRKKLSLADIFIGIMKFKPQKHFVVNGGRMTELEFQNAIKKLNNE